MADPLPADLVALIENYEATLDTIRDRVTRYALATWEAQTDHGDRAIAAWIAALTPIIEGGQQLTGTLTANYLAAYGTLLDIAAESDPIPPELVTTMALRGVPADELYRRPQYDYWEALRNGDPSAMAVTAGGIRLGELVATNLQLARTHAARHVLTGKLGTVVIGYRRVTSGLACSLCADRSGKFQKSELMSIHPKCKCGLVPIYRDGPDPGELSIEPGGVDDRGKARIVQHGEIGPMLVREGDQFAQP